MKFVVEHNHESVANRAHMRRVKHDMAKGETIPGTSPPGCGHWCVTHADGNICKTHHIDDTVEFPTDEELR